MSLLGLVYSALHGTGEADHGEVCYTKLDCPNIAVAGMLLPYVCCHTIAKMLVPCDCRHAVADVLHVPIPSRCHAAVMPLPYSSCPCNVAAILLLPYSREPLASRLLRHNYCGCYPCAHPKSMPCCCYVSLTCCCCCHVAAMPLDKSVLRPRSTSRYNLKLAHMALTSFEIARWRQTSS